MLDLGCGFGRHLVELARRTVPATGVDPSDHMVEEAKRRLTAAGHDADVHPLAAHQFDGSGRYQLGLCLFTSFGQQNPLDPDPSDDSTTGLLLAASRSLAPGAPLVLEVPERERTIINLAQEERFGDTTVLRTFDSDGGVREVFSTPGGTFHLAYRSFDRSEITTLLEAQGFQVETILERALVEPPKHLMTVVARNSG